MMNLCFFIVSLLILEIQCFPQDPKDIAKAIRHNEQNYYSNDAPHLEPFDNANDPNRKFAKEEVEGIPSAVLSKYDGLQQKTADFFKPKPVLDGIREEDKYGNTGDQFQFLNNLVVRSFEAISNVVNKIIDAPGKTLQKVLGKAVDVGNNIGGKVVGLA